MRVSTLSDNQLMEHIISVAREYRKRFGKSLGITGEVGEYRAAQLLNLTRAAGNINEGYDAVDSKGRKVQIKSRIYRRNQERTSVFKNYGFDYAILVLLSEQYEITEIYKAACKDIRDRIKVQSYTKPALSISDFKKIAKRIYP